MHLRFLVAASASVFALALSAQPADAQFLSNLSLNACIGPNGQARLVPASESCHPSERRVSWPPATEPGPGEPSSQGPAGPAGPQGPEGPAGPQGETGAAGPQGETGPAGPQGPQGEPGVAGADGAPGPMGPQGPQGERGLQGEPGVAGADGAAGPMGPQGPQGERGLQGEPGVAGADGAAGPTGPQGPQGDQGPAGLDGSEGPIGPQGPAGSSGAAVRAQHSWMKQFDLPQWNEWVPVPPSTLTFVSEGGPLLINVDMSLFSPEIATFSCRPMIDGSWAGTYGAYPYSDMWTEGLAGTTWGWIGWSKSRLYTGIPAGTHTLTMECRKDRPVNGLVGHAIVPQSISILEMH